jgi:type VI protein secretion system component VasF
VCLRRSLGTVGDVLPLLIIGAVVLALLLWFGVRLLLAGRQLDRLTPGGSARIPVAPRGSVAAKVDGRLQRTRVAVETLVMPEVSPHELHPSTGAFRDRAQTYVVLGACLLGLAAAVVVGFLLVL